MCALVRLSNVSAVCVPVKSMLKTVAVKVIDVCVALIRNVALPNDAGRGAPAAVVGTVGGVSWALVNVAVSEQRDESVSESGHGSSEGHAGAHPCAPACPSEEPCPDSLTLSSRCSR